MMIIVFSMTFKLLPGSGMRTIGVNSAWDVIQHGIMPALVLSLNNMAVFVRYIRSNTIVQLEEEYVLTAVSKGAGKKRIMYGHVLKNCMLPVITSVGSRLGTLVTGSFIIESVFAWPGLGTGNVCHNNRDYPMIMGITMFSCTMLLLGKLPGRYPVRLCRSQDQTGKGVRYGEITDTTQSGRPEGGGFFKDRTGK